MVLSDSFITKNAEKKAEMRPHQDQSTDRLPWIANKSIIIAGGGISGLSFALSLHKRWPSELSSVKPKVTILERDSESDRIGREGYTMSLRTDGPRGAGIQVLDDLGLYETTLDASVLRFGQGGSMTMWDANWNTIIQFDAEKMGNNSKRKIPGTRIRRNALQRLLVDAALDVGAKILWEKEAIDVRQSENDNRMEVVLSNGDAMGCDLVVAADGSKSKIRNQIRPENGLDFAGPVMIAGNARFQKREDIPNPLENDWGLYLGGNGIGMFLAPVDETSALWSVSVMEKTPQQQLKYPMSKEQLEGLLENARHLARQAGPKLETLIDATDPTTLMRFNCMDRPPFRHTPAKHGSVVFIGDSCHAVSPFAGNGANHALMDGWELAGSLMSNSSLEVCLRDYDDSVVPRTQAVLAESRRNIAVAHSSGWTATFYWMVFKIMSLFFGKSRS